MSLAVSPIFAIHSFTNLCFRLNDANTQDVKNHTILKRIDKRTNFKQKDYDVGSRSESR